MVVISILLIRQHASCAVLFHTVKMQMNEGASRLNVS